MFIALLSWMNHAFIRCNKCDMNVIVCIIFSTAEKHQMLSHIGYTRQCGSLLKFLKLIQYPVTFLITWNTEGDTRRVHILVTSAQTFPNWYIAQLPLTHFQDRALKELQAPQCAQNSPTELNTYSIEHQQYLYSSLAEWTTKSFQSLLLLLWHVWPLLMVSAILNSAIHIFLG